MKKTIWKMTSLFLSAVLLCGCAGAPSSEQEGTAPGSTLFTGELEKNVTIRVLENDTAIERGYFKELIAAFNEAYEEYGITAVDANMDQYLDLANDGPYGYGPDVLYQANDVLMKYVKGRHILPLPVEEMECRKEIPEAAWEAYRTEIDGKIYTCGVPVNVQAPMLYYRKDMLPSDWETAWDENKDQVPDMLESWNKMHEFSIFRHQQDSSLYGYMESIYDPYFSCGYLFTFGGYVFGDKNTNPEDIGFSAGDAYKGARILKQQASVMTEECIDETIQRNMYTKLAEGTYFACVSTPDVYTTFLKELVAVYEKEGLTAEEAEEKARENLIITGLPRFPASGDLTEEEPELKDSISMGGINGYAVSAYTKAPNACLAFVEFATGYEMMMKRSELLGIAPARNDAATDCGGLSQILYDMLEAGNIVIMPSIQEVAQIWTPLNTLFSDLAKDAFRKEGEQKYIDEASCRAALEAVDKQIYDAIFTLTSK